MTLLNFAFFIPMVVLALMAPEIGFANSGLAQVTVVTRVVKRVDTLKFDPKENSYKRTEISQEGNQTFIPGGLLKIVANSSTVSLEKNPTADGQIIIRPLDNKTIAQFTCRGMKAAELELTPDQQGNFHYKKDQKPQLIKAEKVCLETVFKDNLMSFLADHPNYVRGNIVVDSVEDSREKSNGEVFTIDLNSKNKKRPDLLLTYGPYTITLKGHIEADLPVDLMRKVSSLKNN